MISTRLQNIAILGGLGHIGSGWIRKLNYSLPNVKVTVIDNLMTQRFNSLYSKPSNVTKFIEMDVRNPRLSEAILNSEFVFHFAAITNSDPKLNDLESIISNNLASTINVIDACAQHDIPLIFPSSTSVYEKNDGQVNESTEIAAPSNPYSLGKYLEEEKLKAYSKSLVLRLGTIHGISPGMRFHTAVNKFCWEAVNNIPISLWKNSAYKTSPYLGLNDLYSILNSIIMNNFDTHALKLVNLVSHNSTPHKVFEEIHKCLPKTELKFIDEDRARSKNLIVTSEIAGLEKNMKATSLGSDILETINLLTKENFSWNEYYRRNT